MATTETQNPKKKKKKTTEKFLMFSQLTEIINKMLIYSGIYRSNN